MNLRINRIQRLSGGRLERFSSAAVSWLQLLFLRSHKEPDLLKKIAAMKREGRGPLANEAYLLYSLARSQSVLPGDFAEVGVSRGGSAMMICEGKRDKRLHLFDTFSGIPETNSEEQAAFRVGQYACSREEVENYLAEYVDVTCHVGRFPDSAENVSELEETRFSLVNLDVDLYDGTKSGFEFFYPRLCPGGIIVCHDYSLVPGVRKAVDEFVAGIPEEVVDLPTTQCMLIKQ